MNLVVRSPQCMGGASHRAARPCPAIYEACIAKAMGFIGRVRKKESSHIQHMMVTWEYRLLWWGYRGDHHGLQYGHVCVDGRPMVLRLAPR